MVTCNILSLLLKSIHMTSKKEKQMTSELEIYFYYHLKQKLGTNV